MHPASLVKRRAQALNQLQGAANVIATRFDVAEQAQALERARAKEPQVDTLLKLEALAALLSAMAREINPAAPVADVEPEESAAESDVAVPVAPKAKKTKAK